VVLDCACIGNATISDHCSAVGLLLTCCRWPVAAGLLLSACCRWPASAVTAAAGLLLLLSLLLLQQLLLLLLLLACCCCWPAVALPVNVDTLDIDLNETYLHYAC